MSLNDRKQSQGGFPWYLRMVAEFAVHAIEEQDFLIEEQQESLRFALPGSGRADLWVSDGQVESETGIHSVATHCIPRYFCAPTS